MKHKTSSLIEKFCELCGSRFETRYVHQKYCSYDCCVEAKKLRALERPSVCATCGKSFHATRGHYKYCSPECAEKGRLANSAYQKSVLMNRIAKAENRPTKSLDEWVREARECNLDYGTYRAMVESQGKTYEELKATAAERSETAHQGGSARHRSQMINASFQFRMDS